MGVSILPFGAHKAFFVKADKVLASKLYECLSYQGSVLGTVVLLKRALKLLFVIVGCHVNGLHSERIKSRSEHNR